MKSVYRKIASLCAVVIAMLMLALVAPSLAQPNGPGAGGAHPYSTGQHGINNPGVPNWARNGSPYVQNFNNTGNCFTGASQTPFGPYQMYPMGLQSQSLVWQNAWMQDFGGFGGSDPWSWYSNGPTLASASSGSPGSMIAPFQSCGANLTQPGFGSGW